MPAPARGNLDQRQKTMTQEYLDGLRDERAIYTKARSEGHDMREFAAAAAANAAETLARGPWAREIADYLRAGRDFWQHQARALTK